MMKKILLICSFLSCAIGISQSIKFTEKKQYSPADTSSYSIVQNLNNIDVHNSIPYRRKISSYRKSSQDFLLDFGNGLKVLIYKEEEK